MASVHARRRRCANGLAPTRPSPAALGDRGLKLGPVGREQVLQGAGDGLRVRPDVGSCGVAFTGLDVVFLELAADTATRAADGHRHHRLRWLLTTRSAAGEAAEVCWARTIEPDGPPP